MDPSSDSGVVGDIPLLLADATKAVERAPNDIAIGLITLRGWQLHRLLPLPPDFDRYSGYLVRVNYDFDIAAGVPAPAWAEVAFTFPSDVTVVDALPRAVTRPDNARSYELNQHLNFVRRNRAEVVSWPAAPVASDVALPAVQPRIDCFGVGGELVRWRHTGSPAVSVPVGTHAGWLVLLTSPDRERLPVLAFGQYWLEMDPDLGLVPASRRDAFTVSLPVATAPLSGPRPGSPRVFLSYSQETPAHKESVLQLCALLETHGIDVRVDQQGLDERRIWTDWTNTQILRADYVIVVASPAYRAASEGTLAFGQNLGVRSEYLRLADLLHRDTPRWTKKILPVVLPGRSVDEIPLVFLPGTADHYIVDDFTPQGAASLLQVLLSDRTNARPNHE